MGLAALLGVVWAGSAGAHEFWIEPLGEPVMPGAVLEADLKVGTELVGESYVYLPKRFHRFDLITAGQPRPVTSEIGARPAVAERIDTPGLAVLAYVSRPSRVEHDAFAAFEAFADEEGLTDLIARHDARGLDRGRVVEIFSRYAKALVPVGGVAGEDTALGLPLEVVVTGPPSAERTDAVEVAVLAEGTPVPDIQLSAFHRDPSGKVTVTRQRTDADGRVTLDLAPGFHLFNAVQMIEPARADALRFEADWHSLWASTTLSWPPGR